MTDLASSLVSLSLEDGRCDTIKAAPMFGDDTQLSTSVERWLLRPPMIRLRDETIAYLRSAPTARATTYVLEGLPGVGKSTCLSMCFRAAQDHRTERTLILRAVSCTGRGIFSALLDSFFQDNEEFVGCLERMISVPVPVGPERLYVAAARDFLDRATPDTFSRFVGCHQHNQQCKTVVLIDQWNTVESGTVFSKARDGRDAAPGLYVYAPSGTWNSRKCDRVPPRLVLRVSSLTADEARTIVKECVSAERDVSGIETVVARIGGSCRLLCAWATMNADAFENFARGDARERVAKAFAKAAENDQAGQLLGGLFRYYRCGFGLPLGMRDDLFEYGVWDDGPSNAFVDDELKSLIEPCHLGRSEFQVLADVCDRSDEVRGAMLASAFARCVARNKAVYVRNERIEKVDVPHFISWSRPEDICAVDPEMTPVMISLPPRFPVIDFIGIWNGGVHLIQVSVSKYAAHRKKAQHIYSTRFGDEFVYDVVQRVVQPVLDLPPATGEKTASHYPQGLKYIYATTSTAGRLPFESRWEREVLRHIIDEDILDVIAPPSLDISVDTIFDADVE